jgi:hypothetical protein
MTMGDQGFRRFGLGRFLLIASIVAPASVLPLHAAVAHSAGSYGATASLGAGTWVLQLAAFAP